MAEDTNPGTNVERNSAGGVNDSRSRRAFLKAAVVGTAGVATAAGVIGVDLASYSKSPSILSTVFNDQSTPSRPPSGHLGFEPTSCNANNCTLSYGGPGNSGTSRYLIFFASELPAGSYTFDCSEQGGTFSTQEITSSSHPWAFQGANPVHVHEVTAGHGTACPDTHNVTGTPASKLTVSFTLSSKSDVEIFMHLNYSGHPTSGETTVFSGMLTGTVSLTATETVTAV